MLTSVSIWSRSTASSGSSRAGSVHSLNFSAIHASCAAGESCRPNVQETSLRALAKLEQVLPSRLRHRVGDLRSVTVPLTDPASAVDPDVLTAIAAAVRHRESLRFGYRSHDGAEDRARAARTRRAHPRTRRPPRRRGPASDHGIVMPPPPGMSLKMRRSRVLSRRHYGHVAVDAAASTARPRASTRHYQMADRWCKAWIRHQIWPGASPSTHSLLGIPNLRWRRLRLRSQKFFPIS